MSYFVAFSTVAVLFTMSIIVNNKQTLEVSSSTNENLPIYNVQTEENAVSLTMNCAWNADDIDSILDTLNKCNVKITFFIVGDWADKYPEAVKKISENGHEIGNHSCTHPYFNEISEEDMKKELESTSKKIKDITGEDTKIFRPPYGEINEDGVKVCESLGYKVVNWDVDSMDWKNIKDIYIIDRVSQNATPGSIILFQGEGKNVENYLDSIISHFSKSGYKMLKISELLYDDNYYVDSSGVQRKKE